MGKRFVQAATITCMLFLVMKIGLNPSPRYSSGSTLQIITDDSATLFPALKAVFQ
ncbi:MAG: hypothetical protein KME11_20140 [Timaviella obliquedivisa GSE-PSE-MK23-08B]|jgi:hypothetical protein|nr:hypothetical protein [Timaviella obliquedivisa GSE-PSE-MK23-08B]